MIDPGLGARLLAVASALESAAIPYAFGGAIALNYYAEPRITLDLDINVFLPDAEEVALRVLLVLRDVGVPVEIDRDVPAIVRDGQVRLRWDETPVDLFFVTVPLLESAAGRATRVPFDGGEIGIISAEDLAVCKILFDREKDWADLRAMILYMDSALDQRYVLDWLDEMIGIDDPRVGRFVRLLNVLRIG